MLCPAGCCKNGGMSDEQPGRQEQPNPPEPPQQPEPQWIAVPPANPHAQRATTGQGRGTAISAMALGLVAALTTGVSAFYFDVLVIAGAVLGLLAIGLGIAALAKRYALRPASTVGIAGGALAVLGAAVVGGIALAAWLGSDGQAEASGSSDTNSSADTGTGAEGDDGEEWTPDQEQESLIEWPSNMGTGGVLFAQGADGPTVQLSDPVEAGKAPAPIAVDRGTGPADILLYVDYRCPHCVDFEEANAATLGDLVTSGRATVEIRPMAFVSPFSVDLSNAMACVVSNQPRSAWNAHLDLLARDTQHLSTVSDLVDALDEALGGIDPAARECIESGEFSAFAQALSQWYVSSPVPNAVDPTLAVRGTPLAVVNGVAYTGDPADAASFAAFLAEQGL